MRKKFSNKVILNRITSAILILALLNLTVGCHYYKVSVAENAKEGISKIDTKKYVILHYHSENWSIDQLTIDQDSMKITGVLSQVSLEHSNHNLPKPRANRYKPRYESPENEIHIYVDEYQTDANGLTTIPFSSISRIDVYSKDMGTTGITYMFTIMGGVAFTLGIFYIILLLTKSSCPFVYIKNGETYTFYGEIYGGAISQNMERDDFMPLPKFESVDGSFDLKITNELKERQYTDVAELFVVEHANDTKVLLDKNGKLHTFTNLKAPVLATTDLGSDLLKLIEKEDSVNYYFLDETKENADFSSLKLTFERPSEAVNAKLLLNVKNTLWLDFAYGKFIEQFGNKYDEFFKQQDAMPAYKKRQWTIDQGMLLEVKIKKGDNWVTIDEVNMVGPLAQREIVIPFELFESDQDKLEIKLECGYHFWEIDYAAIDYSSNIPLDLTKIKTSVAKDQNGIDVASSLALTDKKYLSQLNMGDEAYLAFKAPEKVIPTNKQSVFLHTRGYYEYIRDFKGKPNISELKKFKEKGSFTHFSKENLLQLTKLDK